jgi:hypothetical protein
MAQLFTHQSSKLTQDGIPRLMTEGVIDILEVIDIKKCQGKGCSRSLA